VTVIWRKRAETDRERIFDYIARDNPRAALALDEEFKEKAAIAERNPELYRPGRIPNTREIVVKSWIMVYRVRKRPAAIVVSQIVHGRQQWP
jgi:addiction module RelE/StbE family toxin